MNYSHLTLSLFLLFSPLWLFGQSPASPSGRVVYHYFLDTETTRQSLEKLKRDNPRNYAEYGAMYEKSNTYQRQLKFELLLDAERALFTLLADNPPTDPLEANIYQNAVIMALGANDAHYLDRKEKLRLRRGKLDGAQVNIISPFNKYDWKITGQEKCVGGRTLYEAKTTETITTPRGDEVQNTIYAWFTPDIPLPFGPGGFNGLPGLILELRFGEKRASGYDATLVEIGSNQKTVIKKPKAAADLQEGDFQRRLFQLRQARQD